MGKGTCHHELHGGAVAYESQFGDRNAARRIQDCANHLIQMPNKALLFMCVMAQSVLSTGSQACFSTSVSGRHCPA
ncbi:hypothetical protein BH11VER1_BH11VER1_03490 [soil metagenome]